MRLLLAIACVLHALGSSKPRIGIVTMHSQEIMSYANMTAAGNLEYAERHGYGFHILDHVIDRARVPHWTKIHAIQIHLADYDFLFWIDADAMVYDQTQKLEDVFDIDSYPDAHIWAQDIWPDFPALQREELMDGATILFRNSLWTRQFLIEMYHFPPCQDYLNWTEQYCLTVAFKHDLLGMKSRTVILQTPRVNHHRIPSVREGRNLFVFHYAGRSTTARARHFRLLRERFQVRKNIHLLHVELHKSFTTGHQSTKRVIEITFANAWSPALKPANYQFDLYEYFKPSSRFFAVIGEKFGTRMAAMDIVEYQMGRTRDGEEFVKSFFCDLLVVGVESWRHLPQGRAQSSAQRDHGRLC
ncbi:unnamed protein product [Symbiodinium natans]|uniref:Uncharacterized protein n=1 Tax=Symbiodinium natans TaxID=878477 RepID=A0A812UFX6_9DINO|nr:unnamed protein product [Symbiodinium natans]